MIVLSIIGGVITFFVLWALRLRYLVAVTDKEVDEYFKDNSILSSKTYNGAMLCPVGDRVFVLRPLKHAQIVSLIKIFILLDKGTPMEDIVLRDDFYFALGAVLMTSRKYEDVHKLSAYIKDNLRFNQGVRILRIIAMQNDVKDFISLYKEMTQVGR